ncbi:CASP2 [Mytilus coruscus]|uniref:CASP2 n=1 Tax=Mytilus coruscus TaxID=42192 RepID=A0A6J8BUJ1_MYTCO|nr:CASP2 [Mytilus coruscus]
MTAENYDWKNAFKKNRVKIVKGLANPDEVASELFQLEIFNSEMFETILQMDEREQKTRKILDTLNYRGKKGVGALHKAFVGSQNEELAKDLADYVIEVEKRESKTEPKEWPPSLSENTEMMNDHVIRIEDVDSPWYRHEYGKEFVYNIYGECRGKVFIINNVKFETWGSRKGSDNDADNLSKLFTELHFTVQRWDNLTANKMISNLCSAANEIKEKKDTECVILIIMSHGGGTRVYGVDCMPVQLKTLTDCFSSTKCPTLRGKPRLVFVQACRSVEIASIEKTSHIVKHNGEVEIECIINTKKPILEVSWMKNADGTIQCIKDKASTNKYRIESMKSLKSLIVMNIEDSDKGKYHCIVKYESKYRTNPSELKLDVVDVGRACIRKTIYSAKVGADQIKIECFVRNDKSIKEVFWEKDAEVEDKNEKYLISRDKTMVEKYRLDSIKGIQSLIIKNVIASDRGKYRCIIRYNDGSQNESNPTELEVDLQGDYIASLEKTIHVVKPGGQVEIECIVDTKNYSILGVFWEKDAKDDKHIITEKSNPNKYSLEQSLDGKSRKLIVKSVEISDIGRYRCIVKYESKFSSNPTEVELDVKDDAVSDVKEKRDNITQKPQDELDSEPYQHNIMEDRSPKPTLLDHPSSDFLIAYATPEGTKAWLHGKVGSWFMNAIVWTFKYHAHEEELHHLLIRVNRLVGKGCTWSNDMTVAEVKSNLRKKFYFFPGIHGNPPELFKNKNSE